MSALSPFGTALQDFGTWLGKNSSGLGYAAGAVGSGVAVDQALSEASRISNLGTYLNDWSTQQGNLLDTNSQFKGYGITTGLGQTTAGLDPNGKLTSSFGVGPSTNLNNQGLANRTQGGLQMGTAANYLGNAAGMVNGVNYMDASNQAITGPRLTFRPALSRSTAKTMSAGISPPKKSVAVSAIPVVRPCSGTRSITTRSPSPWAASICRLIQKSGAISLSATRATITRSNRAFCSATSSLSSVDIFLKYLSLRTFT